MQSIEDAPSGRIAKRLKDKIDFFVVHLREYAVKVLHVNLPDGPLGRSTVHCGAGAGAEGAGVVGVVVAGAGAGGGPAVGVTRAPRVLRHSAA